MIMLNSFYFADSGVESSTTYLGQDGGAISDCELTQSQSIDEVGEALASPAPTLEDAMQRLAETIKEFDSHALTDEDSKKLEARSSQNSVKNATNTKNDDTINSTREHKENVSQGQIIFFCLVIFIVTCLLYPDFQISVRKYRGKFFLRRNLEVFDA